jgi:hypothetical protein
MSTLTVFDVVFTARTINAPEACPKCGASLTEPGSVREWNLEEEGYSGSITPEGWLIDEDSHSAHGDGTGSAVSYCCRNCCEEILASVITFVEPTL